MADLLAMTFDVPVVVEPEFRGYRHRAERSPRGWGVAWYVGERAFLYKEAYLPGKGHELDTIGELRPPVQTQTLVGHILYGKREDVSVHRTGPFIHPLNHTTLAFAASGALHGVPEVQHAKPEGDHPLELAFCWLLDQIRSRGIDVMEHEQIESLFRELNELGNYNAVMTDGVRLWVYHDKGEYKDVFVARLTGTFDPVVLLDEDWDVDIRRADELPANGYVLATNRLFETEWLTVPRGKLVVFENGNVVYE